jgi:hypothetical protein
MRPNPRRGTGGSNEMSNRQPTAPFDDVHTCRCGGPLVRRRDGRPGRRCGRCGRPADRLEVRVRVLGQRETWIPRTAFLAGRGW